ncbi:MAG TPA: DUF2508 family protein [Clostridiaceae bacterium]|nr:DUF2508 family protein [Clostridiaceae bacterium]
MTGQAIKQKPMFLGFLQRLGSSRAREAAKKAEHEEYMRELAENIRDAYMEWQNALANYETADCKEMIDYYAYRIKASEIRYEFLLRKAKEAKAQ